MTQFALIALVRNQAPYLLEWTAHHLALGCETFAFCVYGSSDGSAQVTRRLAAMGYGHHLKIDASAKGPRAAAIEAASGIAEIAEADWVGLLDVSEFLNIHTGHGHLADLTDPVPAVGDALALATCDMAAMPTEGPARQRITEACTARAAPRHVTPTTRPTFARSVSALSAPSHPMEVSTEGAQINRYFAKSRTHLAQLLATAPPGEAEAVLQTWIESNTPQEEDRSIARYEAWTARYLERLMKDKRLRQVREQGLAKHQGRAEKAQSAPDLRALLQSALGAEP